MTTIERIKLLRDKKNISNHALEINTGIAISSIRAWETEKAKPSVEAIKKIAKYFEVSSDYLLCLTNDPTPLNTDKTSTPLALAPDESAISEEDQKLLDAYHELRPELRQLMWDMIKTWQNSSSTAGTQKKKA